MKLNSLLPLSLGAALVACGSDDPTSPADAAGPDAVQTPDAAVAGTVTLNLRVGKFPVGSRVLFLNPDDSVVSDVAAAVGEHSAELLPGGSILLVAPVPAVGGSSLTALAWLGVTPGTSVAFPPVGPSNPANVRSISFSTVPGAATYRILTPCNTATNVVASPLNLELRDCGATTDVFIAAYGPAPGGGGAAPLLKSRMIRGVSTAADIDGTGAYVDPRTLTATVTNLPPSTAEADVEATLYGTPTWSLDANVLGDETAPFVGSQVAATGPVPAIDGASLTWNVQLRNNQGSWLTYQRTASTDYDDALAVSELPAPWIQAATIDTKASRIRPLLTGPGAFDLGYGFVQLETSAGPVLQAGGPTSTATWVYAGVLDDDQSLRLPTLPSAYAALNLTSNGAVSIAGQAAWAASNLPAVELLESTTLYLFTFDVGDNLIATASAAVGNGI